ncbi:MAG: glutaminase A [Tissierellia bacterium]|nr:glutaminase A [Tissierellia bacterium]
MEELLKKAYDKSIVFAKEGKAADYIPELGKADITKAGVSLIDLEGNIFSYGDTEDKFSIQSILKVVFYLLALERVKKEKLEKTIGVKPTALAFNSVMDIELAEGKPRNPFVNSGAMASIALLYEIYGDDTEDLIFEAAKNLMGDNTLAHSEEIYQSEMDTAYNNIAIINLMVGKGVLPEDTPRQKVLETYIKTSAILVNVVNLSRLSSIIANNGYDLVAGERKFDEKYGRILRTVMSTCGMYNYAGEFALNVGMPAKSGVGGGIIAAPKTGHGIATYCPGLDEFGNSLVGTKMMEIISKELDLSIY